MSGPDRKELYTYSYRRSADQDRAAPARHPVIVVGAGPVGLALAIDLAQRGVPVLLLDDNDRIGEGSRAICFSKRALEVCDRLGVADQMLAKGVTWQVGKVFRAEEKIYEFDLLPEAGHKFPAFINLQQYYAEAYLVQRALALDLIEIRWKNRVTDLTPLSDGARIAIETPDGSYELEADWLIACDGAGSPLRAQMGLDFKGKVFQERFLIADVKMKADFPSERWFWFDPPFHSGQSALLHKQPDDVWRIDLQLGWDADPEVERQPANVIPRLKAMLGAETEFELEWVSIYTFQSKRIDRFVHDRVIFAGDSAHQVSPFGARGCNSGFEDAQNLAWKLAAVIEGRAGPGLIASYGFERELAADDNIGHSTRSTDFIAPQSDTAKAFRNATLALAKDAAFARRMVNSGRLSLPSVYEGSPLSSEDSADFDSVAKLGAPAPDAPLKDQEGREVWLLDQLDKGFTALFVADGARPILRSDIALRVIGEDLIDTEGLFTERYDVGPGSLYLLRPDQYICARFRCFDAAALSAACDRALGRN